MIADHPWFGTGLGTFVWSFPAYRSANISLWGVWDLAHSTPLELAADLGLPLAGSDWSGLADCLSCADPGGADPPSRPDRAGRGACSRHSWPCALADRFFAANPGLRDCSIRFGWCRTSTVVPE